MFNELRELVSAYRAKDPAARSFFEVALLYPGIRAVRNHRRANWCWKHGLKFIARLISQRSRKRTGVEIHPGATIGRRLVIDHGMGIVIGETAEVGDDVLIYQGVTLGGTGKDQGKRHPTVGDNVLIGSGAKVLGPISIGSGSRIAAGAVVLKDVPENATAVGVPARVVKLHGLKVDFAGEIDQTNVTDPMAVELRCLRAELDFIKKNLNTVREGE